MINHTFNFPMIGGDSKSSVVYLHWHIHEYCRSTHTLAHVYTICSPQHTTHKKRDSVEPNGGRSQENLKSNIENDFPASTILIEEMHIFYNAYHKRVLWVVIPIPILLVWNSNFHSSQMMWHKHQLNENTRGQTIVLSRTN